MSEQKMREALERIKVLTEIPFAHTAGDHDLIYQIATEALAQQPAAVVELTDDELWLAIESAPSLDGVEDLFGIARSVIAAHIAKQGGAA